MTESVKIPVEFVGYDKAEQDFIAGMKRTAAEALAEAEQYASRLANITDRSAIDRLDSERNLRAQMARYLSESERAVFVSEQRKIDAIENATDREKQSLALRHRQELLIAARAGDDVARVRRSQIAEVEAAQMASLRRTETQFRQSTDRLERDVKARFAGAGSALVGALAGYASVGFARQAIQAGLEGMDLRDLEQTSNRAYQGIEALNGVMAAFGNSVSTKYARQVVALGDGFGLTAKEIESLALVAQASLPVTGQSLDQAVKFAFDTVTKFSKETATQLAATFDAKRANEEYAKSIGTTVSALTEQQKRSAAVIELTRGASDQLRKFPASAIVNDIQRVNASFDDLLDTMRKLVATEVVNPLASWVQNGTPTFLTEIQTRAEQAQKNLKGVRAALAEVDAKLADRSLSQSARMPSEQAFSLAGISAEDQAKFESYRNSSVALLEVRKRLNAELRFAERLSTELTAAEQQRSEQQREAKAATEQAIKDAERERQARAEAAQRAVAIRQAFETEQQRLDNAAAQERLRMRDEIARIDETDAQRAQRLLQEKHAREIAEIDAFTSRMLTETRSRHRAERVAAESSGADLIVLAKVQAAELEAIKRRSLDVGATLDRQVAESEKLAMERASSASDIAMAAETERSEKRRALLEKEISLLRRWLLVRTDIDESAISKKLAQSQADLFAMDPQASIDLNAQLDTDLQGASPITQALADLGNTDLTGLREQLLSNVVSPLEIATEMARAFADSMFDAAFAAIFEAQNFREATNIFLRDLTKRALKLSLFSFAQAAIASGLGQYDKAKDFAIGGALYGAIALASGIGTAATGGFGDKDKAPSTDRQKPEGIGANRGSQQTTINLYVTQNGIRSDRADFDYLIGMLNKWAGSPGAAKIDGRAIST